MYRSGDWLAICDRCGFRMYGSEGRKEWNGSFVCKDCWEPKHPQFIQPSGLHEKQTVPVHRPEPTDKFITTPITADDL